MTSLFCFGLGFSALALARRLKGEGWNVAGTARSEEKCRALEAEGFAMARYNGKAPGPGVPELLGRATHIVVSVPPGGTEDPVLLHHGGDLARAVGVTWIGYLSTVGVYGDHDGGWVDETTPPSPVSERSRCRVAAEGAWADFGSRTGKAASIFRLSGIYGPGRNAFVNLKRGMARRIVKPGQVFNRIHVVDIASSLQAAIAQPRAGAIYNVSDDEPAPPQDVIAYAATLLDMDTPPDMPFAEAELGPMARSFYGENKRVANDLIKRELGVHLAFPTYREGLRALLAEETSR